MTDRIIPLSNKSSVRQRQVSAELRAFRLNRNLTCQQVADALDWSVSKVSRMETGVRGLFPDDVAAVLGYLGAPSKVREELLSLVRDGETQNWIQVGSGLPKVWKNLARMESDAKVIRNYEPLFVPALLQTGDYARAVLTACNPELATGAVDQLVRTRINRQAILACGDAPMVYAIIDEMVLRRPIGAGGCMYGQLQHLAGVAERSLVQVRVVPFTAGANPGMDGPVVIMEFDAQPTLVHVEFRGVNGFVEDPAEVRSAKVAWRELSSMALSPEDSKQLIHDIVGEL